MDSSSGNQRNSLPPTSPNCNFTLNQQFCSDDNKAREHIITQAKGNRPGFASFERHRHPQQFWKNQQAKWQKRLSLFLIVALQSSPIFLF